MKKITLLFLSVLVLGFQASFAVEENKDVDLDDFNFDYNSSYITDEQLQEAQEINTIENKTDFRTKVINSGHFFSDTATKTYIPINKIQK